MPREADINNPQNPTVTTPPVSWVGKNVKRKEEYYDLVWQTLASSFPYFEVTFDNQVNITLKEFGGALFVKSEFYLV